jgi:hypothetical protein
LLIDAAAHPMLELVAARFLLIALDEMRSEGIVVERVRVELDGQGDGEHGQGILR